MEIVLGAAIISLGIVLASYLASKARAEYHVKPKLSFAQVTVVGRTEESESMQLTCSLLEDETEEQWNVKINKLLLMREARMGLQNQRMIDIQNEQRRLIEAEKVAMEAESKSPN